MTALLASAKVSLMMKYRSIALSVPFGRLRFFMEELGLTPPELAGLAPYKGLFAKKGREFADYFHDIFMGVRDTRKLIEQLENPQALKNDWANWFETVFASEIDEDFMAYQWRIGIRHVEVNLDQPYSNMGFAMVRKFCGRIIRDEVPEADQARVSSVIDKILDFCLLTETTAYIEATSRCDVDIIGGIADRIRNPITVIGGNLKRIQKNLDIKDPSYCVVEDIIAQSSRCAAMVADIKTYVDMYQKEAQPARVYLPELFTNILEELSPKAGAAKVRVETGIDPQTALIEADPEDIRAAFYKVLENAIEAAAGSPAPRVAIASEPYRSPDNAVKVTIFNTGIPVRAEDADRMFALFYSTKPGSSGLGLPIARLAIRKSFGRIAIEPAAEGTRVVMVIPKG